MAYRIQILKANIETRRYEGDWVTHYPYPELREEAVRIAEEYEEKGYRARIFEEESNS